MHKGVWSRKDNEFQRDPPYVKNCIDRRMKETVSEMNDSNNPAFAGLPFQPLEDYIQKPGRPHGDVNQLPKVPTIDLPGFGSLLDGGKLYYLIWSCASEDAHYLCAFQHVIKGTDGQCFWHDDFDKVSWQQEWQAGCFKAANSVRVVTKPSAERDRAAMRAKQFVESPSYVSTQESRGLERYGATYMARDRRSGRELGMTNGTNGRDDTNYQVKFVHKYMAPPPEQLMDSYGLDLEQATQYLFTNNDMMRLPSRDGSIDWWPVDKNRYIESGGQEMVPLPGCPNPPPRANFMPTTLEFEKYSIDFAVKHLGQRALVWEPQKEHAMDFANRIFHNKVTKNGFR
jgi:hypothetical protein